MNWKYWIKIKVKDHEQIKTTFKLDKQINIETWNEILICTLLTTTACWRVSLKYEINMSLLIYQRRC